MHIKHKQFLALVAEASGLELGKAEEQLSELVQEIKQSLNEGEAYEIEGFGIFSILGNRVMFIPSDELETEVNFKYVGMEPIELDEPKPTFEDPFEGLDDSDRSYKSTESRFAGLIDNDISDPLLEPDEQPGPESWGVQAHKEDESADRLFASLMGEEYSPPVEEPEGIDTSDTDNEDDFSDVFAETTKPESSEDLGAEVAAFMSDDATAGASEPSTDDLLDDIFADSDEELIDELIEEEHDNPLEFPVDYENLEEEREDDTSVDTGFNIEIPNDDEEDTEPETEDFSEMDDFEDPFFAIEEQQFDESVLRMEDLDETEIVPVIKNITTDASEPVEEKEKTKKELQQEEKERKRQEKEDKKLEKERKKQELKEAKEKARAEKKAGASEPAPAWLWVVLAIVIIGGGVVGLGYFNVINIPFITPQTASNTVTTPPVQPPITEVSPAEETANQEVPPTVTNSSQEQGAEPSVQQPSETGNEPSLSEDQYGLTGSLSAAGNDGYTIILYTLSNQTNAVNEAQKLIDAGYRGFLTPVPSDRFGTLYRVSLGQFGSLFDAAVAAEEVERLLPDNYIIKKIN